MSLPNYPLNKDKPNYLVYFTNWCPACEIFEGCSSKNYRCTTCPVNIWRAEACKLAEEEPDHDSSVCDRYEGLYCSWRHADNYKEYAYKISKSEWDYLPEYEEIVLDSGIDLDEIERQMIQLFYQSS
jgi:hypothetical protein